MKHLQKRCLSCQFFRPIDTEKGLCRIDKSRAPAYPETAHEHCCEGWRTCGQQYYIRAGWVKKQMERAFSEQEDEQ